MTFYTIFFLKPSATIVAASLRRTLILHTYIRQHDAYIKASPLQVHINIILAHYMGFKFKKQEPEFNVILDVLHAVVDAQPKSEFAKSLLQQYLERGSLSKKQLQGLHSKASKISAIPAARLATLEATIIKMPNRFKSELPAATPLYQKDETVGAMINSILEKYPQHKTVLLLKRKYNNNEILGSNEIADLKKFMKLLVK